LGIYWDYVPSWTKKSFKIDGVLLKAFNPKDKKVYTLRIPPIDINYKRGEYIKS